MIGIVDNRKKPNVISVKYLEAGEIFQTDDNGIVYFKVKRSDDLDFNAIILNGDHRGESATFHEDYKVICISGNLYIKYGNDALPY